MSADPHSLATHRPQARGRAGVAALLAAGAALSGCATGSGLSVLGPRAGAKQAAVTEIYQRAEVDRTAQLELEIERLRADLHEAEAAMVAIESGLRDVHGRADAVSSLAEARVEVERAARNAPWSEDRVLEAQRKLEEAEAQFQEEHTGSAIFFASRARRIAEALNAVAERVEQTPGTRFVDRARVNLRSGPSLETEILAVLPSGTPVFPEREEGEWALVRTFSGQAGWVYSALLRDKWSAASNTTTQSLPASLAR